MADQPARVAIVTQIEVVGRGLAAMLADYPKRVVPTTLPSVRSNAPGVDAILYDSLCLHRSDGHDLDHLVRDTKACVIAYTHDMRPDLRARALAKGCIAWVPMRAHAEDMVGTVEDAVAGEPVDEPADPLGHDAGLTPREVDTIALVTRGLSNQEIAEQLSLSVNTLKSHIRQAYHKIGVENRPQAVSWAIQNGFPPEDPPERSGLRRGDPEQAEVDRSAR